MSEIIDINITQIVEEVTIIATPTNYIVNIIKNTGGGGGVTSVNGLTGSVVLTIPDEQVNSDWNATSGKAEILNKPTIPSSTNFVPYTGATSDVNLGEFGLQTGNIEFDLTPTNAPTTVGSLVWNDLAGTLDLKLKGGAVTLQIGQETVARIVNKTSTNITLLESNYQAVRVTGAQGQRPKVDLALANNDLNSTTTLGLVTETILNNAEGFITTSGQVQQINTTGSLQGETWADGDVLYLSGTVAGRITNIKPIAPIHTVIIGFVEYAHAINGKIFVKVDNGYELEELHNVSAIAPNNNEVLTYDTPTLLWKPKTVISALGYTPIKSVVKDTVQSSTVTGVTTEVLTGTYLIPANTFLANDMMKITSFLAEKTGTAGICTIRVKVGTTNVFSSATLLASHASAIANLNIILQRSSITLRGGNIRTIIPTGNILTDIVLSSSVLSSVAFNPAIDNYIFTSLQLSNANDSAFQSNFIMTN
jgi:hypothetical protein